MRIILQVLFALICVTQSFATQIQCVDTLAGAAYPEELKYVPREFGIRGFAKKEFGDFFPAAKQALTIGRPWVGVNLSWSDTHTYGDKDMPAILAQAKRYEPLCQQFPGIIELATFTEHNLKNPDKYHDQVQAVAPSCTIINSIWQGATSKKYKNEVHGKHAALKGRYNFSHDGTNSTDRKMYGEKSDLEKHKNAEVFCVWHRSLNLRYNEDDKASREQRVKEVKFRKPDAEMLSSLVYLFTNPRVISIPLNKGWTIKTHADKHNATDQKGNKLCIITPVRVLDKNGKYKPIELKRDGKVVAVLPYYGTFEGGGYRHYWTKFGFRAGANLGLFIGKKQYGLINGGFRTGTFR